MSTIAGITFIKLPFARKTVITMENGEKHIFRKNKNGDFQSFKFGSNTTTVKFRP